MPAQVISYIDPPGPDDLPSRVTANESGLTSAVKVVGNTLYETLSEGSRSVAIQVFGDSTGNAPGEWADLIANDLAAKFGDYEVRQYFWDSGTETMPTVPVVTKAPPLYARRIPFSGVGVQALRHVAPSITGDLDVAVKMLPTTWALGGGIGQILACKFAAAGVRGWRFYISSSGQLTFDWSTDGTALQTAVATSSYTPLSTSPYWVRAVLDVNNGAGGHDIKLYHSLLGETWTQIGSTVTRASATSIFDNSAQPYEIGARDGSIEPFIGDLYEVRIRNGIDGYFQTPCLPEAWYGYGTGGPAPAGSPILTFVNGSMPGADLTYLDGGTVLERMTPGWGQVITLLSVGHNEGRKYGPELYSRMATYVASIKARLPAVPIVALTQNPAISPATYGFAQAARRSDYLSWDSLLGWTSIDTYRPFLSDGRGTAALISVDGIHPNADGSRVWADEVKRSLGIY